MNIIEAQVAVHSNGKKIAAIKAFRAATGCGLVEAKAFVERCDETWGTLSVRMTVEQFGNLVAESFEADGPSIEYHSVRIIRGSSALYDFTKN